MASLVDLIIFAQHFIISFIGIIGNLLVLVVYKKKLKDNQTITFFIVHLAITDFLCCVFLIPINCYHELNIGRITSDFMCKFHSFLNIINITYSCLLMALVAFERFFSIVYPFKKLVTKQRAKIIMFILLSLCLTIGLVGCLGIGIYHQVHRVFSFNKTDNLTLENYYQRTLSELDESSHTTSKNEQVNNLNSKVSLRNVFNSELVFSLVENKTRLPILSLDPLNKINYQINKLIQKESLIELYQIENQKQVDKNYKPGRNLYKRDTLRGLSTENRDNRTTLWMPTNNCFPNDRLISIKHFPYIRLFQNLIVVICFSVIFVLYAFLCVVVSKRRHLKASRQNYYKEILFRSKQNTVMTNVKSEVTLSRNNSFLNCLSGNNNPNSNSSIQNNVFPVEMENVDYLSNQNKQKVKSQEINNNDDETKVKLLGQRQENENKCEIKETEFNETNINNNNLIITNNELKECDLETNKNGSINTSESFRNRNKSTQTKSSTIANLKKPQKKRKRCRSVFEDDKQNKKKDKITSTEFNKDKEENKEENNNKLFSLNNNLTKGNINYNSFIANLKTAFMLFVVTVVMAIVYTPALLTSIGYLQYNPIHWNIIYINNAANPLIYSFLNSKFRKSLKNTFRYISISRLCRKKSSDQITKDNHN